MPFVDEQGQPVTLSPEEQAQYFQQAGQPATPGALVDESGKPVDPFSLSSSDLADLATKEKDKFDLVSQFAARPDLQKDPATVAKVADAFHQLREQPWYQGLTVGGSLKNVGNVVAGLARFGGKAVSGTLKQLGSLGIAASPEEGSEEAAAAAQQESRQELGEAAAATEQGMTGLVSGIAKTGAALARGIGLAKPLKDYDQTDKVNALFDALSRTQQAQQIASGQGALAQAVTGGAVPVRPEEVSKLTDPFSWEALGAGSKGLGAATRAASSAIADLAPGATAKAAELVSKLPSATELAGGLITGASKAGAAGARAVEKLAGPVGAIGSPLYALATQDPKLLAESLLFGSAAGERAAALAEKTAKGLETAADFGKQISSGEVKSAYAAAIRDAIEAAPRAAGQLATGVGFDLSQVAGADTPQERQSAVGLGTAFGLLGAANSVGRHVISGQIIGPRAFDVNTPVAGNGQFPALDAMHNEEFANLTPGQRARVNATRLFLSKSNPNADLFVANPSDPDNTALTQALVRSGMDPETAQQYAQQNGVATRLNGRKVIVVKEPGAAPHEAFHGIEDVLGEALLRNVDPAMKAQYANQWEDFGRYYASRLLGSDAGPNWRDTILDKSGWGQASAAEKAYAQMAQQFSDEARQNGQPPPTEQQIKDAVAANGIDWRQQLSPEEQKAAADRYVSRELLAENFDAWFKHTGGKMEPGKQLPERVARILGNVMRFFGENPLAGRQSEALGVPLSPESIKEATFLGKQAAPTVEPAPVKGGIAAPVAGPAAQTTADTARRLAAEQPNVPLPGQNQTQREIAGAAAEAFANDSALHLQYSSAPDEPAASLGLGLKRQDRRSMIEAFRQMPDSARQLFGKLFFPKKFIKTKASGIQIQGWSPEVFAANAHRWSKFIGELAQKDPQRAQSLSQYEIGPQGLTEKGWQDLYNDLQNFVANQRAGKTGAGEGLVVPRKVTEAGYFAPPTVGRAGESLPQEKADLINMLFGFRLPGTEGKATRAGGAAGVRLPQNIAGRLISEATQPGRVSAPVEPRGAFGGAAAEKQGVAGEPVMEVNPYRKALEQAAKDSGVNAPSMIESWQNLNLNRIKEAELASEQPKFGANPLILQAGFLPRREVALEGPDGKKYRATFDGYQDMSILGRGMVPQFTALEDLPGGPIKGSTTYGISLEKKGFKVPPMDESAQFHPKKLAINIENDRVLDEDSGHWISPDGHLEPTRHHELFAREKLGLPLQIPAGEDEKASNLLKERGWAQIVNDEDIRTVFVRGSKLNSAQKNELIRLAIEKERRLVQEVAPGRLNTLYAPPDLPEQLTKDDRADSIYMLGTNKPGAQFQPKTFVVRHGSTEMNNADPDKDLIRGHINVPLDAKGRKEAEDTAKQIASQGGVQHIITSDLDRTVDTAKAIQDANPGSTITEDSGLRPWNFGPTIEGHPTSEMLPKIAELTENPDKRPPGGETFNEFKDRFLEAYHRAQDNTQDVNSAIVTHYRGKKLLDAWRAAGTDNDAINRAVFESYDKSKKPGSIDVIDKRGEVIEKSGEGEAIVEQPAQFAPSSDPRAIAPGTAVQTEDGEVFEGPTHQEALKKAYDAGYSENSRITEGFLTNTGRFVDRVEGYKRALAAKQITQGQARMDSDEADMLESYGLEKAQMQPKRRSRDDYKLPEGGPGLFQKAWIMPDGRPVQLGDQMHHDWLNDNPAIKKQYGIKGSDEDNRVEALQKGFARINYEKNTGTLTVEARATDWPKLRDSVKQFAQVNLGKIDNMDVSLLDPKAKKTVAADGVQLHSYPTVEEKMEQLPFIGTGGGVTELSPQASSAEAQFAPKNKKDFLPLVGHVNRDSEVRLKEFPKEALNDDLHRQSGMIQELGGTNWRWVDGKVYWWGDHDESQYQAVHDHIESTGRPVTGDIYINDFDPSSKSFERVYNKMHGLVGGQYLPATELRALRSAAIRDPETGQIFEAPFHAMAVQQALGLPNYRNVTPETLASFEHGFTTNEGEFLDRAQSAARAAEMNQLQKGVGAAQMERKGGIGIEHLKNEVLTQMNENRKNAIPNLMMQALPADIAGVTNRKDISDARKQWAEKGTESPYFKRWFGDSKVVDESGDPQVVYHGTTHKFSAFGDKRNNPENSLGAGHYFTTDKFDAANNYASVSGPDLKNRIEYRAEQIYQSRMDELPLLNEPGENTSAQHEALRKIAIRQATRELTGTEERMIPAYLKSENPVVLDREGSTSTRFEYHFDEDTGQETGTAIDLHNSLLRVAADHGVDGQKIWNDITQNGADDLNAYDVWKGIKDSEEAMYGNDPEGRLMGSEIARQVFQDMGYDGIELTHPAEEFPGMNIDPDAKHYVVFKPEQIKGVQNRGTFSQQDPRYQFLPKETIAAFKDEKLLPEALHNSQYAIITANRESVGPANHPVNQQANDNLEKALIADGYQPQPVKGEYKGVDQGKSFLVPDMTPEDAIRYAKNYEQESVLTPHGLLYQNGEVNPAVPADTVVGESAKQRDGWSQVEGGPAFSMGLDFEKRVPPAQFAPQADLFGAPIEEKSRAGLSSAEKGALTKEGLAAQYPEAVIPKKRDQAIGSDILASPLYKRAIKEGGEPAAVNAFADRLESFAKEYQDRPAFKDGAAWYDHIAPAIKKAFGKTGQLFAEFLAATSPGQTPDLNFRDALQAHDRAIAGDYDKKVEKYHQGLEVAGDEKKWKAWLGKHGTDLPANPTPETFLGQWIDFHDLKPTKTNGKLFGHNSVPVLNVAARNWIEKAGPKTSNFVKNLLGLEHEATIDLWADRTMRWAGYEGEKERWRILPENKSGVDDKDFDFAQKVFSETAKRLGMRPDQLQGALWFAEKQRWADNGWSPLNLGTYEPEFERIPEYRARIAQEQTLRDLGRKTKPLTGTQSELMVSPRKIL